MRLGLLTLCALLSFGCGSSCGADSSSGIWVVSVPERPGVPDGFLVYEGWTARECDGSTTVFLRDGGEFFGRVRLLGHELIHAVGLDVHSEAPCWGAGGGWGDRPCEADVERMRAMDGVFRVNCDAGLEPLCEAAAGVWNEAVGRAMFEVHVTPQGEAVAAAGRNLMNFVELEAVDGETVFVNADLVTTVRDTHASSKPSVAVSLSGSPDVFVWGDALSVSVALEGGDS